MTPLARSKRQPHGRRVRGPGDDWAHVPDPLPPPIEWTASLAATLSAADRAIGRLAGEGRRLPNPHLLIRPFVRREAVLSSRIEGTQATLGGGETFLASLALALELSEQVQRAASAVPLDSLFIDEGFGTLDPATLDAVALAIQSLPVGGRMVGIITHVRELAESLPARIVVEKRPEGSRVRVETE